MATKKMMMIDTGSTTPIERAMQAWNALNKDQKQTLACEFWPDELRAVGVDVDAVKARRPAG